MLQILQHATHSKAESTCKQEQLSCSPQALQQAPRALPAESLQLSGQPKLVLEQVKPLQQANTPRARLQSLLEKSVTGAGPVAQVPALQSVPASQKPVNGFCGKSCVNSAPQAATELSKAVPVCSHTQLVATSTAPVPGAVAAIPASTSPHDASNQAVSSAPKHASLPQSSSQSLASRTKLDAVKQHPESQPEGSVAKPVQERTTAAALEILKSYQVLGGASTVAGSAQQPATKPTSVAQAPANVPAAAPSASPSAATQGAAALDPAAACSDVEDTSLPITAPEVLPAEPSQAQSSCQDETAGQAPLLAAEALPGRVKRLPGSSALEVISQRMLKSSWWKPGYSVASVMPCLFAGLCKEHAGSIYQVRHQHKVYLARSKCCRQFASIGLD